MYTFRLTPRYKQQRDKLIKSDKSLGKKLEKTLAKIAINPHDRTLRSHKVDARVGGIRWSSRVSGNIRLIWDYDEHKRLILILLDFGGHSGKKKVYK